MPLLDINDTTIHYTDTGKGDEVIVFAHGLLFDTHMWDAQIAHLKGRYRCIAYDHRGQGKSGIPEGGYDMDSLAEDAAALIHALGVKKCHFVGLSMGGFVALRLAHKYPELLTTVSILDSSADAEHPQKMRSYSILNFLMRWIGGWIVVGSVMPIMFSQGFLKDKNRTAERDRWRDHLKNGSRIGWPRAVKGVVKRDSFVERLKDIHLPTLILVGAEDTATEPEKSRQLHHGIAGSKFVTIENAGHLSAIEQPAAVNAALEGFLQGHSGA